MPDTSIAFQIGGLTLRWYGILISLSLALGIYLASLQAKKGAIIRRKFLIFLC